MTMTETVVKFGEAAPAGVHQKDVLIQPPPADLRPGKVSRVDVHTNMAEIEQEWRTFEKDAACTVFQTFSWLASWQRHVGRLIGDQPCIVMGRDSNGVLAFILPLAAETRGPIRRLVWLGCDQCDYNAPIASAAFLRDEGPARFRALWPEIVSGIQTKLGARIDLVDLDKMPDSIDGLVNPVTGVNVFDHPSGAHIATLGESWESFYKAKRSSPTRKNERKKLRYLAEYGDIRAIDANATAERALTMDILIEQKKRWFACKGVGNIFASQGLREFYMAVVTDPGMHETVHVSQLLVGDETAAAAFGLRHKGRYYSILSSYADAEYAKLGPGRVHMYELMRGEIDRGIRYFDFTVGDEAYKRNWADLEVKLYDYLQPLTLRGWFAVRAMLSFRAVKRFIKQTPLLWRIYCSLRARLAGVQQADSDPHN